MAKRIYWLLSKRLIPLAALAAFAAAVVWQPLPPRAQTADIDKQFKHVEQLARQAKYNEAILLAKRLAAAAQRANGGENFTHARALSWLAFLHQTDSRLKEAEPYFKRAAEILQKIRPPTDPSVATAINNLGMNYLFLGQHKKAERLFKRSLELRENAPKPNLLHIADSLNNIAQVYKSQDRIAEAEPLHRRALKLREKVLGPEDPIIAQSLQNLAGLMELQGHFAEAEPLLRRAKRIRKKAQTQTHPEFAGVVSKLAQNLYKQRRYGEAGAVFAEALWLRHATQPPGHVDIASSLVDLAYNEMAQGRFGEAAKHFAEALAIRQRAFPAIHSTIAAAAVGLAEARLGQGRLDEALAKIRQATVIDIKLGRNNELSRSHYLLHLRIAWRVYESRGRASRVLIDEALVIGQHAVQTDTAATVVRMAARFAHDDHRLRALVRERDDLDRELIPLDQELSQLMAIAPQKRRGRDKAVRRRFKAIEARLTAIDHDLKRAFPKYFALARPTPLNLPDITGVIRADEALIAIVSDFEQSYVWAVTGKRAVWRRIAMGSKALTKLIKKLRNGVDTNWMKRRAKAGEGLFDLGIAHRLYKEILGPVEQVIAGKAHLVIAPSGVLTSLPFHLMVRAKPAIAQPTVKHLAVYKDTDWIIRSHAISVLPSIASLKALRDIARRQYDQKPLIGFGDPYFGAKPAVVAALPSVSGAGAASALRSLRAVRTRSFSSYWRGGKVNLEALSQGLPQLPETREELQFVARQLGASEQDIRLGKDASEAAVKSADLANYRVVYFATHGLVAGDVKGLGEPALALSLPDVASDADDGLLTASEVTQLKLNAEWVVLSACNTAAGDDVGAEALSGLARAFFHAGARAMLVSHWYVASDAAVQLTTATFRIRSQNQAIGRAEALRRAMIESIDNKDDPWGGYPAFWGPFSIIGEGL